MALPMRGACRTEDGSLDERFDHSRRPGLSNRRAAQHKREAEAICQTCPALDECKVYAAKSYWTGVTIAGWSAPTYGVALPPWAEEICTMCGDPLPDTAVRGRGVVKRCRRCKALLEAAAERRWYSSYTPDGWPRSRVELETAGS